MQPERLRRRRFLQAGGAVLAMAAAGCTGSVPGLGDDDGDDPPSYADWVGVEENDDGEEGGSYVYASLATLHELDDEGDEGDEGDDLEDIDDPMLGLPLYGYLLLTLGVELTLAEPGLEELTDEEASDDYESSIDDLLWPNDSFVMTGSIDTEEIDAELTAEPDDPFFGTQFERDGEKAGYAIYVPVADDESNEFDDSDIDVGGGSTTTIGVDSGAIIIADDREAVERTIEVAEGDETRAADEYDEFHRLLSEAGRGAISFGAYNSGGATDEDPADDESIDPDDDEGDDWFEDVDGVTGLVTSLTVNDSGGDAELAITFDELDDDEREELEDKLGSDADDVSIDFDGDFVSASASYSESDLDEA